MSLKDLATETYDKINVEKSDYHVDYSFEKSHFVLRVNYTGEGEFKSATILSRNNQPISSAHTIPQLVELKKLIDKIIEDIK